MKMVPSKLMFSVISKKKEEKCYHITNIRFTFLLNVIESGNPKQSPMCILM